MESAGAWGRLARAGLVLTLAAVGVLVTAATALADVTPSRGGPGPAANQSGSGGWIEIGVVLLMIAGVALAVFYDGARRRERALGSLDRPTAAPAPGSEHRTAA